MKADHPRIRGEHPAAVPSATARFGSSPHTRGALATGGSRDRLRGIIPAYAGSTDTSQFRRPQRKDHPRIRGEHGKARELRFHTPGSSPHTRGARACSATTRHCLGIIPAYAGSTRRPAWSTGGVTDHPRIRGEHRKGGKSLTINKGSSPHTRGAPRLLAPSLVGSRIIPAYAGSTLARLISMVRSMDHPRIRGEHRKYQQDKAWRSGSSPHTRGAHTPPQPTLADDGIIPAYAGSTYCILRSVSARRDHPRIRGEHRSRASSASSRRGSSPHTRGALRAGLLVPLWAGIIPAYAGSTVHVDAHRVDLADHPRIRGEHSTRWSSPSWSRGSSPHTRGAHRQLRLIPGGIGIIPAYAGSTRTLPSCSGWQPDHPRIRGEHVFAHLDA